MSEALLNVVILGHRKDEAPPCSLEVLWLWVGLVDHFNVTGLEPALVMGTLKQWYP